MWSLGAHWLIPAGAYLPGFWITKQLGVFLLRLDGMLVQHRYLLRNLLGFLNDSRYPFILLGRESVLTMRPPRPPLTYIISGKFTTKNGQDFMLSFDPRYTFKLTILTNFCKVSVMLDAKRLGQRQTISMSDYLFSAEFIKSSKLNKVHNRNFVWISDRN